MSNWIKSSATLRLIRCAIGDETYGLDMSWVYNIQRVDRLRPASEKGAGNAGFVGWLPGREHNIPVFSLAKRLERPVSTVSDKSGQRIIVLPAPSLSANAGKDEERLWALLVDHVSQVIEIPGHRFEALPALAINSRKNYFEGVIKLDQGLMLFISPEWLHPDTSLYIEGVIQDAHQLEAQLSGDEVKSKPFQPTRATFQSQAKLSQPQPNGAPAGPDDQRQRGPGRLMLFSTQQSRSNGRAITYGLSITQISEILRSLPLTQVPAAPDFVLGIVNWRDRLVPVIDLDARLGLVAPAGASNSGGSRLLIARGVDQKALVGFSIQSGNRALRLPISYQPASRRPAWDHNMVKGVFELEDETLVIPDMEALLRIDD